ncbi:hypothetical protein IscW_ISCW007228 [Ixodes scapularis]|uniref:MAM domain-containing protein n=1 Tax=Ixodes scapularis TaxID=6945 RepID=B7PW60_IXOSC|nr:hypothetical protein IscW_ISCW007228 [Ixodes scapularis]|eukprot:XP_002409319.1 hypothetical protein IscW_ISCW007228 [Ixodes scapularis]
MIVKNRGSLYLTSPMVPRQAQPVCATLRYHFFGGLGAYIRVSLLTDWGDGTPGSVKTTPFIYQLDRASVDRWFTVRRTLDMRSKSNEVVFRVNVGAGEGYPLSSFGIDDVQLDPEPCRPLLECDFEEDFCGYVNDFTRRGVQWLVGTGRVAVPKLSPKIPPPHNPSAEASGGEYDSFALLVQSILKIAI